MYRAGIKHQATDELSRLKTKSEDRTPFEDEIPAITIFVRSLACAALAAERNLETIEEPKGPVVFFISKVCMLTGTKDNEKVKIPILPEFITAQSTDSDYRTALTSVQTQNTRFDFDCDEVFVRAFA